MAHGRSLGRSRGLVAYEKLKATFSPWDSELFKCKVGKLEVTAGVVPADFVREANEGDFDVVFVRAQGWHEEKKGRVALDWRYEMELPHPPHKTMGEPSVIALQAPLASHLQIAEIAFVDSRFYRDPLLAEKAPELYRRWLMNQQAQLWALEGNQKEDGFLITTVDHDDVPRISLIGVAAKYRGLGLGERLAIGVMDRFENAKAFRVTVAVRNWRAIRFYEGLGFRVKDLTSVFHVWL